MPNDEQCGERRPEGEQAAAKIPQLAKSGIENSHYLQARQRVSTMRRKLMSSYRGSGSCQLRDWERGLMQVLMTSSFPPEVNNAPQASGWATMMGACVNRK